MELKADFTLLEMQLLHCDRINMHGEKKPNFFRIAMETYYLLISNLQERQASHKLLYFYTL